MGLLDPPATDAAGRRVSAMRLSRVAKRAVPSLRFPKFSSITPTVTLSAANAGSTITSGAYSGPFTNSGRFASRGGTYTAAATDRAALTSPPDPPSVSSAQRWDFAFDGQLFEFVVRPYGTTFQHRIWIDGEIAPVSGVTGLGATLRTGVSGGADYKIIVDLGSRAPFGARDIRFDLSGAYFGGVITNPSDTVCQPLATPKVVKCAVVGDSLAEGTYTDAGFLSITHQMCDLLGWDEPIMAAQGGTGFLNPGVVTGRQKFRDRITDVAALSPDEVVVLGGYNDLGGYTSGQIGTEATLYFNALRAALPKARIWAGGPWSFYSPVAANTLAAAAVIQSACEAVSGNWIDMLTDPWIRGTGSVASPVNNGNAQLYITSNGDIHPPQAGQTYYAVRTAQEIRRLIAAGT